MDKFSLIALTLASFALPLSTLGCNDDSAHPEPLATYTPTSGPCTSCGSNPSTPATNPSTTTAVTIRFAPSDTTRSTLCSITSAKGTITARPGQEITVEVPADGNLAACCGLFGPKNVLEVVANGKLVPWDNVLKSGLSKRHNQPTSSNLAMATFANSPVGMDYASKDVYACMTASCSGVTEPVWPLNGLTNPAAAYRVTDQRTIGVDEQQVACATYRQ